MESIVVEAIRQLPALALAVLAFYFYRSAKRASAFESESQALPDGLMERLDSFESLANQLELELQRVNTRIETSEGQLDKMEEENETIRSQLSNQKMALKEFGRVLSKTSEQTYTEFNSYEERFGTIEKSLSERGMLSDDKRSAAA